MPVRRPQILQQEIHSRPQAVDKFVTLRDCPHRYPQKLSTSVRSTSKSFPPLGTKSVETCGLVWITLARNGCVPTLTFAAVGGRVTKDLGGSFGPCSGRSAVHSGGASGQRCGQRGSRAAGACRAAQSSAPDLRIFTGDRARVTHSTVESACREPVENPVFPCPQRATMVKADRAAVRRVPEPAVHGRLPMRLCTALLGLTEAAARDGGLDPGSECGVWGLRARSALVHRLGVDGVELLVRAGAVVHKLDGRAWRFRWY